MKVAYVVENALAIALAALLAAAFVRRGVPVLPAAILAAAAAFALAFLIGFAQIVVADIRRERP